MENRSDRGRINVYLSSDLKEYVDSSAKNFGVSTSAFMTMIIQSYKQQSEAMKVMGDMGEILNRLEALDKKIGG